MPYCAPAIPKGIPVVIKAASATLNYGFDLSPPAQESTLVQPWAPPIPFKQPWLQPGEEVISLSVMSDGGTSNGSVSTWTDITIITQSISPNEAGVPGALIQAWVSGGTPGVTYGLQFVFSTNSSPVGRVDERTIALVVVTER